MLDSKRSHQEIFVKVNALCDQGIAPLVEALNRINGLITLESCEEAVNGEAWVFFTYGNDCQTLAGLLQEMASRLSVLSLCCSCILRLEWLGNNEHPRAQVIVRPKHVGAVSGIIGELAAHLAAVGDSFQWKAQIIDVAGQAMARAMDEHIVPKPVDKNE